MDELPESLVWEIVDTVKELVDRKSVSLTCKRLHKLDNEHRKILRVGCGLDPPNEALITLCSRFTNLEKVEIIYSGWMSKFGKQLDDQGLHILSNNCHLLNDLTLSYCTSITNTGLSYLASCSRLVALRLNFTPRITGCGLLSVSFGCKKLKLLHLIRCLNIKTVEWLEYLGKLETLEDLCVINCKGIGEGDLMKLGPGWRKLKHLQFEVDADYCNMKGYDRVAVEHRQKQWIPCESMVELSLVNCIVIPERGLACALGNCSNLEKIYLDMCVGVRHRDILDLAQNSKNLRSISLRVSSEFSNPRLINDPSRLKDESLKTVAQNCSQLESFRLAFTSGNIHSFDTFTSDGLLLLIKTCPIRELSLYNVCSFDDLGMRALLSAHHLQILELMGCHEVTDMGLQLLVQVPRLSILRLGHCFGVSDEGLKPLVGVHKLESLHVDQCPRITEMGVQGAAKSVAYKLCR